MTFSQLGLSAELLKAVADKGYDSPTPVQQQAIPPILQGNDILAGSQTGTGKTASFTLPLLQRLSESSKSKRIAKSTRALILTPTRELAAQVFESVENYGRYLPLRSASVFGGVSINPQIKRLQRGVDILVATPGRLLDLVKQKHLDLSNVEFFILDEADRMLDMGFIPDIRKVTALMPRKRQNMLFSATFPDEIKKIGKTLLNNPTQIAVSGKNVAAHSVSHVIYPVERERKRELLSYLIGAGNWQQVLVFARTKHGADRLGKQLQRDGIRTAVLHGNKSQGARTKALEYFKTGSVSVLVATDIAARGLDIQQLPHVVNFDLPAVPEDYVHRIGRTGRAGFSGEALSLVCQDEVKQLTAIERVLKKEIPRVTEPGFETRLSMNTSGQSQKKNPSPPRSNRKKGVPVHRDKTGRRHQKPSSKRFSKKRTHS